MTHSPSQIKKELKEVYEKISGDFSQSRSSAWPEFSIVSDVLDSGDKVLDLGCGNGRLYDYLVNEKNLKLDYIGIDFCSSFISIAQERYPQAEFYEADISSFDLEGCFDSIVSIAAFHHLPSRGMRVKCLKQISNHLEDDGTLIVSVWNLWQRKYWKYHLRAFSRWLFSGFRADRKGLMIPFGKEKIERYYHAFSVSEIKELLYKQGFQVNHFEVSRHNFFFICHKKLLKAQSQPIKNIERKRQHAMKPSHAATCK